MKEKKSLLQLEITQRKVPRKELMHFSRQMAVFIRAGIPVLDALETITEEMGNKIFKQTLLEMKSEAERIETLLEYYRATIPKVEKTLRAREKASGNGHVL